MRIEKDQSIFYFFRILAAWSTRAPAQRKPWDAQPDDTFGSFKPMHLALVPVNVRYGRDDVTLLSQITRLLKFAAEVVHGALKNNQAARQP